MILLFHLLLLSEVSTSYFLHKSEEEKEMFRGSLGIRGREENYHDIISELLVKGATAT